MSTEMSQEKDSVRFMGYVTRNGEVFAKFREFPVGDPGPDGKPDPDFILSWWSCRARLRRLQMGNLPHEETLRADTNWPASGENLNP